MKFLGTGLPKNGDTDVWCAIALDALDAMLCRCGCGQWADEAHDPATQGRWQPHITVDYARAELEDFRESHKDDLKPHHLVWLTLVEPGVKITDPFERSEDDPAAEYAAMMERVRLASQGD